MGSGVSRKRSGTHQFGSCTAGPGSTGLAAPENGRRASCSHDNEGLPSEQTSCPVQAWQPSATIPICTFSIVTSSATYSCLST